MGRKEYNFKKEIVNLIENNINVKEKIIHTNVDAINDIVNLFINAYKNNKKILWCGNGGSAADAQHLACELVSKLYLERKPLRSIALTTNTSTITAISNDYDFEKVFERQVEALADKGDILVGITTSGTSPNIINAFRTAKKKGVTTVAFTGKYIDEIEKYADFIIPIPSSETPYIQESHIMIGHILCDLVEKTFFGDKSWETKQSLLTETGQ